MKIKILITILFTLTNFFTIQVNAQMYNESLFKKKTFTSNDSLQLNYRILFPDTYIANSTQTYPLVLFLHGSGERGTDNQKQLTHVDIVFGKPEFLQQYKCFVIIPQCNENYRWVNVDWKLPKHKMPSEPSDYLQAVMQLMNNLTQNLPIDSNRLYIMGLSMGGFGTWDYISRYPDLFAAAVPICGGGDENKAPVLKNMPLWVFHGAKDNVVPVGRSRNMVAAVKKAGNKQVKYTEFKNTGHNAWTPAFNTKGLFDWLFAQNKK